MAFSTDQQGPVEHSRRARFARPGTGRPAGARPRRLLLATSLLVSVLMVPRAFADQVILPAEGVERDSTIDIHYRLPQPATGRGTLAVEWRDALDRVVERFERSVELRDISELRFPLDLRRAVALRNELHVRLSLGGGRESEGSIVFAVPPRGDPWRDEQIIVWQAETARQYAALKALGVTAAALSLRGKDDPEPLPKAQLDALLGSDLPWYVENIATDFYAAYHRWSPDRPVDWRFREVKRLYQENPRNPAALIREPSLSDAASLARVRERLGRIVHAQRLYRPLFYNLADEPGIASLSAFWDFDLSPASLGAMREWLRQRYGSLSALNREWASDFQGWDQVMPMTTAEAIARGGDNHAAWADFKEWMDEAFARALRAGRDAVHAADGQALAAIEGGQVPGWGGYDYARLAGAVDAIELYDGGGNLEILRSLAPEMVLLATVAVADAGWRPRLWREMLRGARGVILWDPDGALVGSDGTPGPRAAEMAQDFREIRSGIGALLIESRRQTDPVAVLYSPASMRVQWLLDWMPRGDAWAMRAPDASYEDENAVRAAMMGDIAILERAGLHPRMVSSERLARGALGSGTRLLFLPGAIALSPGEAAAVRRFAEAGGIVVADREPGLFDAHGRRASPPLLRDLFPASDEAGAGTGGRSYLVPDTASCADRSVGDPCRRAAQAIRRILDRHALAPAIELRGAGGDARNDVATYGFQNGAVSIIGLQREGEGRGAPGSGADDIAEPVVLTLPRPAFVCDLRARRPLGRRDRLEVALRAAEPSLFALAPTPPPRLAIAGPSRVRAGDTAEFRLMPHGAVSAATDVLHIEVADPAGRVLPHYGANLPAPGGRASWHLPLALNDPPGAWTIRVTSLLGCDTETATLTVARR